MYEEIIPLLKCPNCDKSLHLIDSVLENSEIVEGKLNSYKNLKLIS